MMVYEVHVPAQKRAIATRVLADLPEWFGIPESTEAYIAESEQLPFFAAEVDGEPVGFIVLKETSPATAELCVMGVMKKYHRHGIGRALFDAFKQAAVQRGYQYAQVKTVAGGYYDNYDDTRLFYESMGFAPLEVFPTLWDEHNPCLILVMKL
ncbi:MAG: GNAT family N-acetyltransferase [Clostridia bacterium]|nr:GNAT family N-acetyltransferase [Clostridia bacterium]